MSAQPLDQTQAQRAYDRWLVERRSPLDYLPTAPTPRRRALESAGPAAGGGESWPGVFPGQGTRLRPSPPGSPRHQSDVLLDAITGDGREALERLPAATVYLELCALIRDLGMQPDREKVHRVASWISAEGTPPR